MMRGGWNRSVVTVVTVGNGVTRRPSALNDRGVVRWNLVQCCHILHRLLFLTLDPLSRRVQAVNSSPVSPVCWSESVDDEEDWPDEWWHDSESDWMEDWQDDWYWHDSEDCASEWNDNESAYLVCVELQAQIQV